MLDDLIGHYSWADDYSQGGIEAWTVAVIQGLSTDEVIRVYGGEPDKSIGDFYFEQLSDLQGDGVQEPMRFFIEVKNLRTHTVAIENGYTGNLPEIARRCSTDAGQFFSVYWSVNSNPRINQAINGRVTAHFETYPGDKPYAGEPAPPWITGISIDQHHLRSTALALMEQQTGVAFDQNWPTEVRPAYEIPDPHVMLKDVENADRP